jgi:hypothetical protein
MKITSSCNETILNQLQHFDRPASYSLYYTIAVFCATSQTDYVSVEPRRQGVLCRHFMKRSTALLLSSFHCNQHLKTVRPNS